ncbi:hypothetical protein CHLRE_15g644051v5 [Chlamydomonas reinhardtii]|uniref:MoxR domain-containing protein n=1 Tax=Chlamydomonas reinhardtii TaxID=3055 RepID=A0A2K3CWY8_CHLRE|nr:uncharacterized protein CHLRE_15g644051v5 [Chlamydomonas reinhardtii]PNW72795.1 hypothetical protein CHLRE_15g644051v5 [Chlamydomonas reinhardtii]
MQLTGSKFSAMQGPRCASAGVRPKAIATAHPSSSQMHVVRQLGLAPSPFCGSRPSFSTKAVKADAPSDQLDTAMLRMISELSGRVDEAVAVTVTKNNEAARQIAFASDSELRKRVVASIQKLSKGLLERDVEVRLLLLAALCCEHLLLLGPPGTAKSELSRRLSSLCGGTYFERLLTRFSVPEELFGPLSMKGLENDLYVRQTDGYLPTSEVAFVDEIFKANSAILNALLTLLNERLFDNGNQRLEAPLLCLVGASNEMPESEELDALYDRFLIRRTVSQVMSGVVVGSMMPQQQQQSPPSPGGQQRHHHMQQPGGGPSSRAYTSGFAPPPRPPPAPTSAAASVAASVTAAAAAAADAGLAAATGGVSARASPVVCAAAVMVDAPTTTTTTSTSNGNGNGKYNGNGNGGSASLAAAATAASAAAARATSRSSPSSGSISPGGPGQPPIKMVRLGPTVDVTATATTVTVTGSTAAAAPMLSTAGVIDDVEAEVKPPATPAVPAVEPGCLAGIWEKDLDASDVGGYEKALDLWQISGVQKATARLIEGLELHAVAPSSGPPGGAQRAPGGAFHVHFLTIIPYFKVTEVYPMGGGARSKMRRRDQRGGDAMACAERVPTGVVCRASWGAPFAGELEESYTIPDPVGAPDCMHVTSTIRVGDKSATTLQVYQRRRNLSAAQLISASEKRNGKAHDVLKRFGM